jgi:hypothetical protein
MVDACFPACKVANSIAVYFFERPNLSERLWELLEEPSAEDDTPTVVLIHGLAGSGKTQLARRYAKDWCQDHRYYYWFDASSLGSLKAGFKDFATDAGISSTPYMGGEFGDSNPATSFSIE